MFKLVNNLLPEHISSKFPKLVSETNPYPRRHPLERSEPRSRTVLYQNSFFPSTTRLWNELPDNIKQLTSISAFKRYLSQGDCIVPPYYYIGDRISQIIHSRLRLNMSELNSDLFERHLSDTKNCSCGASKEDASHFLLSCKNYSDVRKVSIHILPPIAFNSQTLLFGDSHFSNAFNNYIFLTVHEFIKLTNRFDL